MIKNFDKIEGSTLQIRINDKVSLYKIIEAWSDNDDLNPNVGFWEGKAHLKLISTYNFYNSAIIPMNINLSLKKYHSEQLYRLHVVDVSTNTNLYAIYLSKGMGVIKSAQDFVNYLSRIDYIK